MNKGSHTTLEGQIDLLALPRASPITPAKLARGSDAEYAEWFKNFVESYRCRICKVDLTLTNFGGVGSNHMIFCKDCKLNAMD